MKKTFTLFFSILLISFSSLFILSGCNDYNEEPIITSEDLLEYFDSSLLTGTIEFTNPIINIENISRIIPLGQINPPAHTFPTDHIYLVLNNIEVPIYAPTEGKILHIDEPSVYGDIGIRIGVTNTMSYYLGHIFINEELEVGDTLSIGDQIGISGNTACVDLGVINKNINNNFISQKYPIVSLYGDKPLLYFTEALRTQLYELVKPGQPAEDHDYIYDKGVTDGEFAYDQLGTLNGNWFEEGCFDSSSWYEWENTLSFGYDVYYIDQIRIGIGKYGNSYAIKNTDNPINPKDVSVESEAISYYLYNANSTSKGLPTGNRIGLMMIEMLSDTRIRLEIFDDLTSVTREFTSASLYYVR